MKKNIEMVLNGYFRNRDEVFCVYLFGSVAKGKGAAHSDVDIAVLYDNSVPPSEFTDRQIELSVELGDLLDKNVDVVILNRASPYLKYQVIQGGMRVYENPKRVGRAFEAYSIIEYFDFLPVKNMLESALVRRYRHQ